jgi:hypothetical protein
MSIQNLIVDYEHFDIEINKAKQTLKNLRFEQEKVLKNLEREMNSEDIEGVDYREGGKLFLFIVDKNNCRKLQVKKNAKRKIR